MVSLFPGSEQTQDRHPPLVNEQLRTRNSRFFVRRARTSRPTQTDRALAFIFITFRGTNELLVENMTHPDALNELRQELFPLWPAGVESNESHGDVWRVLFSKDPWSSSGPDAFM